MECASSSKAYFVFSGALRASWQRCNAVALIIYGVHHCPNVSEKPVNEQDHYKQHGKHNGATKCQGAKYLSAEQFLKIAAHCPENLRPSLVITAQG